MDSPEPSEWSELTTLPADYNDTSTTMPTKPPALFLAYNIVMLFITAWLMFSMGSGIKLEVVRNRLRRPVGPVIGFISQCFVLPALMYGYAHLLNIEDNVAIGMIITASTPGGSVSNMFTFWTGGDLDLSVTMTTISTMLAVGFMPLNMYIYVRDWLDVENIPFVDMVITILVVWVMVVLGQLVGRNFPKVVPYLTKLGSVFGFLLILIAGALQGALFPEVFDLGWEIWFGAITMPYIAFFFGFFAAWIFRQGMPQRIAIGFEVGLQNIALALTIVVVSIPNSEQASYFSQFIILYGTFQIVNGVTLCVIIRIIYRYVEKRTICHAYVRWREQKRRLEEEPDLKGATINGTVVTNADSGDTQLESIFKMAYNGSSLELKHGNIEEGTGSERMANGTIDSTTALVESDTFVTTNEGMANGNINSRTALVESDTQETFIPTNERMANGKIDSRTELFELDTRETFVPPAEGMANGKIDSRTELCSSDAQETAVTMDRRKIKFSLSVDNLDAEHGKVEFGLGEETYSQQPSTENLTYSEYM